MSTETAIQTTATPTRELDLFDAGQMAGAMKLAELLSTATGWVPKHLLGNPGACLGIVSLASAWRVNPFMLAAGTADIHGKLLFEAKAVQAGMERSGALEGRLTHKLLGDWSKVRGKFTMVESSRQTGDDGRPKQYARPAWSAADEEGLAIETSGTPRGEREPCVLVTYLKACQPRNSTLWATDPETQATYRATRNWGRRYLPAILLGAVTQDEYDPSAEINITAAGTDAPVTPTAGEKLTAKRSRVKPEAAAVTVEPATESKPAVEVTTANTVRAALDRVKLSDGYAEDYLRSLGKLGEQQTIMDADEAILARIVANAEEFAAQAVEHHKAVNAALDARAVAEESR